MEEKQKPIIDYETIDDAENNSSKNPFKKKEKTKELKNEENKTKKDENPKNIKKIIAVSLIVVMFVAIFVAIGLTLLKDKEENNNIVSNDSGTTIDINTKPNGSGVTFATTSKLTAPERDPSMYTLAEATEKINENNKGIVSYFTEIRETVLSYKEDKTSAYDFEQDLLKYKNNILADVDMLAKYRVMYENYGSFDLYSVQMQRLQNELNLIQSLASTMTDEALVSTFNNFVEKEKMLNDQMVTELKKYFDTNGIQYEENNGYLTYL